MTAARRVYAELFKVGIAHVLAVSLPGASRLFPGVVGVLAVPQARGRDSFVLICPNTDAIPTAWRSGGAVIAGQVKRDDVVVPGSSVPLRVGGADGLVDLAWPPDAVAVDGAGDFEARAAVLVAVWGALTGARSIRYVRRAGGRGRPVRGTVTDLQLVGPAMLSGRDPAGRRASLPLDWLVEVEALCP